jgi:protoheme IX farnesyltransferase
MSGVAASPSGLLRQYLALTKPRVTQLAVFCAVIGMFLAVPGWPDLRRVALATLGIWLLAAAAFAMNCLLEQEVDARMLRTARRATARGSISAAQVLGLSGLLGGLGMLVLYRWVNPLTMWLTFATFVGYALVYTVILKPRTPQNIVIGGLSGAMPPALGWAAMADSLPPQAWALVLIIFIWTPPHFWSLALYRHNDYMRSGLPMLPVTHGPRFTQLHILLYSVALLAATLLPYAAGMSSVYYLVAALALSIRFVNYAWRLYRQYSDTLARTLFRYSILYLALLFGALLLDHWIALLC